MTIRGVLMVATAICVAGCSTQSADRAERVTLYRNSFLDNSMRVHWGTFDANEKDRNYNRNNCEMAARLLNANLDASARAEGKGRDPMLGFWCEAGGYSEKGTVPQSFPGAFPTDA